MVNTVSLFDIANGMFAHRESNTSHYPICIHGRYMFNINRHIAVGALVGYDGYIDSYLYTNVTCRDNMKQFSYSLITIKNLKGKDNRDGSPIRSSTIEF